MKKEEFYYDSFCNTNRIHAIKWVPEGTPLCIVQIVHGMAEHMGRYEEFAAFLTGHNIMVVGADHLGHGLSMGDNPPGYFCKKEPGKALVEDVRTLKNMIREEYPDIPYVLFGHSMGSFITRNFVHRYSNEIDGAVISATGMLPKGLIQVLKVIVEVLIKMKGAHHVSKFVNYLAFGSYLKRIDRPKTKYDWLSTDEGSVQEYIQDPLCGFTFTLNGFKGLAESLIGLYDYDKIAGISKTIPMHFIFGDEDPVGDYGKGVVKAFLTYKNAGMQNITMTKYAGKRHELLHEDNNVEVMNDVYEWINEEILIK